MRVHVGVWCMCVTCVSCCVMCPLSHISPHIHALSHIPPTHMHYHTSPHTHALSHIPTHTYIITHMCPLSHISPTHAHIPPHMHISPTHIHYHTSPHTHTHIPHTHAVITAVRGNVFHFSLIPLQMSSSLHIRS